MPRLAARSKPLIFLGVAVLAATSAIAWVGLIRFPPRPRRTPRTLAAKPVQCHQPEYHAWEGSDHDLAMALATEKTVLGDFNDTSFEYQGVTTKFFRRDGKYMVNTEGPDGELQDYKVKYTFGVRPLQQYMVEFPDGRVQVLRESWDIKNKKWFFVTPPDVTDERILPGDPLHWTGIGQNWNTTCRRLPLDEYSEELRLGKDTYHTTWHDIDVGCEECHGPGSLHVELANANSLFWDRVHGYGLGETQRLADSQPQIEACTNAIRDATPCTRISGQESLCWITTSLPCSPKRACTTQMVRSSTKCTCTVLSCRARCTPKACGAVTAITPTR